MSFGTPPLFGRQMPVGAGLASGLLSFIANLMQGRQQRQLQQRQFQQQDQENALRQQEFGLRQRAFDTNQANDLADRQQKQQDYQLRLHTEFPGFQSARPAGQMPPDALGGGPPAPAQPERYNDPASLMLQRIKAAQDAANDQRTFDQQTKIHNLDIQGRQDLEGVKQAARVKRDQMLAAERSGAASVKARAKSWLDVYQREFEYHGDENRAAAAADFATQRQGGAPPAQPEKALPGVNQPLPDFPFAPTPTLKGAQIQRTQADAAAIPQRIVETARHNQAAEGTAAQNATTNAGRLTFQQEKARQDREQQARLAGMRDATSRRGQDLAHGDRTTVQGETARHNQQMEAARQAIQAAKGTASNTPEMQVWRARVKQQGSDVSQAWSLYSKEAATAGRADDKPGSRLHSLGADLATKRAALQDTLNNAPTGAATPKQGNRGAIQGMLDQMSQPGAAPRSAPSQAAKGQQRKAYADTLVNEYRMSPDEARRRAVQKYP